MNIDPTDESQVEDFDDESEPEGMLIGYELGTPSAFSGDCDLQPYDRKRPGSGCCAVITCDCKQTFRIDLLSEDYSRCPKCKTQYTSLLVVCQVGDDTMLQSVFEHLVAENDDRDDNPEAEPQPEDSAEDIPDGAQPEPNE